MRSGRIVSISLIFLLLAVISCATSREIIDKPVVFDLEREALTLEYLRDRYGLDRETAEITPKMIVLHWTAIPTFEGSFDVFNSSKIAGWRTYVQQTSGLNVSAHFLVDRDGKIYRLMPETTMARHVIGLNHCAIGVENVGGTEDTPMTKAQIKANIFLVKYLAEKYDIEYLIGHYEYPLFDGHELWLEKDAGYRTEKDDPGVDFMREVRKATKNLNFKPIPN
ncbi:peptidoglycan recognition protein family protein [Flavobacteriaceae bacterium D16]|nr:peptidoglycan recognition protein family protein [Flavobacteriaceae bacterium D16]